MSIVVNWESEGGEKLVEYLQGVVCMFGRLTQDPIVYFRTIVQHVEFLKTMEKKRKPFSTRSRMIRSKGWKSRNGFRQFMDSRKDMALFIELVCSREKYSLETLVLAMYIYDRYHNSIYVPPAHAFLLPLVCAILAGKLNEEEGCDMGDYPSLKRMSHFVTWREGGEECSMKKFIQMELTVLDYLQFKICVATEANFLETYALYGLSGLELGEKMSEEFRKKLEHPGIIPYDSLWWSMRFYNNLLLKMLGRKLPSKYAPSLVAAAILMFSRHRINLHFWTSVLESVTGYSEEDVYKCMTEHIESLWQQENPLMKHQPISAPKKNGNLFGAEVALSHELEVLRGYPRTYT